MIEAPASRERRAPEPPALGEMPGTTRTLLRAVPPLADRLLATRPGTVHRDMVALVEHALLAHVLLRSGGNQVRAARALGLNRNTLRKRCLALGLARAGAARLARRPRLAPRTDPDGAPRHPLAPSSPTPPT